MTTEELTEIVSAMQLLAAEASAKRKVFEAKGRDGHFNTAFGESVGIGKSLQVLVDLYPDQMNIITAPADG